MNYPQMRWTYMYSVALKPDNTVLQLLPTKGYLSAREPIAPATPQEIAVTLDNLAQSIASQTSVSRDRIVFYISQHDGVKWLPFMQIKGTAAALSPLTQKTSLP